MVSKDQQANITVLEPPSRYALQAGVSGFEVRRDNGMIYVDKTDLIAKLALFHEPVFIARPRRFGKSLLCTTLKTLFAKGTKNFKGLAIEKQWHEPTYPVLDLNFSTCVLAKDNSNLEQVMFNLFDLKFSLSYVEPFLQEAGVDLAETKKANSASAVDFFSSVLRQYHDKTGKEFVIIIDEYDDPFNDVLYNQRFLKERIDWFSNFYRITKELIEIGCVRFLFITGITRYQHTGIFSGFNIYFDLTFDPEFSALFGYTEAEIQQNFGAYIEYGAKRYGMTADDYLSRLRTEYDGYQFAVAEGVIKVYNPWSILRSFATMFGGVLSDTFACFWVNSGAVSTFVVNFIKSQMQGVNATKAKSDILAFVTTDLTADFSLHKSLLTGSRDPYNTDVEKDLVVEFRVAMTQAGYYTLKELSPKEEEELKKAGEFYCADGSEPFFLRVPNNEIAIFLRYNFWPTISSFITDEVQKAFAGKDQVFITLLEELFSNNPDLALAAINEHFAQIGFSSRTFDYESSLRTHLACMIRFAALIQARHKELNAYQQILEVSEEKQGAKGQADIFVATNDLNVVIELKLNKSKSQSRRDASYDKSLQEAVDQINDSRYYDQYPRRDTLCYAVVFSQAERRAVRLAVFKHKATGRNYKVRLAKPTV